MNKINKEGKEVTEEKNSKHIQAGKTQVKRAQGNRKEENRESPVEAAYETLSKYASHWITIGVKILHWLLYLVSDVASKNADLMIPLGNYRWYHTILYPKCLWFNIAMAFTRLRILNAIGEQLDNWFGDSKLASWRKIKTKMKKRKKVVIRYMVVLNPMQQRLLVRKENGYILTIRDLHEGIKFSPHKSNLGHLAREPTGEMITEENMDPIYTEYLRNVFDKINTVQQISKLKSKEYYGRQINPQNFKIGGLVYLLKEPRRGKFSNQYSGPHKVLEILENQNVMIEVKGIP